MKKKFLALMMATVLATSPVVTNVATAYAAEADTEAGTEDNTLAVSDTIISVNENKNKPISISSPAENCTYKAVSEDKNIATVQVTDARSLGGDVTAKISAANYGSTTVTIEEYDAEGNKTGKTAEVTVNVTVSQDAFKKAFKDISMNAGDTKTLEAILPEGYTFDTADIVFSTTDDAVSITGNKIKAVKNGDATVTAKLLKEKNKGATEDVTATFKVSVKTFVTAITVANNKVSMTNGSTYELKTTVEPETASDKTLAYESSDEKIVTVDDKGVITAVAPGKATVTIKAKDGSEKTCPVEVTVISPVTEITTSADAFNLYTKQTAEIKAEVNKDASVKELSYKSADETIATVDEKGVVTAVKPGKTKITITSTDGAKIEKEVEINVLGEVTSITGKEILVTVEETKTATVPVEVTADNNPDAVLSLNVTTTDEKIATAKVTKEGIVVTAVTPGAVKITVTSNNPSGTNVSYDFTVQVTKAEAQPVVKTAQKITNAKIKTYKASSLKKKKATIRLKAKTSGDGKLTYKVSKYPKNCKKYISVSSSGKVTLKKGAKKGTYKITITASETDTSKKATKTITIKVK